MLLNPGPRCASCPQAVHGVRRVETEVKPATFNGILIVGESPWKDEVDQGRPFVGASGYVLDRWLRKAGLGRHEVAISNALWCKPPELGWFDTPASLEALSHCHGYLEDEIARLKPKAIVTLGAVALRRLAGVSGLADRRAPRMGYIHPTGYGPVIPAPHPSFILQGNAALEPYALLAFQRAKELAGIGGAIQDPWPWPELWLDRPNPPIPMGMRYLMLDIETTEVSAEDQRGSGGNITRIGLAWREVSDQPIFACSLPWNEDTKQLVRVAVSRADTACFWNQTFDKPRLEAEGICFPRPTRDAMLLWHFLQSNLPKALGAAAPFFWRGEPWKHLEKANPAFYNALDSHNQLLIMEGCIEALGRRIEHFATGPERVLQVLDHGSAVGIWVDVEARTKLVNEVNTRLAAAQENLNQLVPESVRPLKTWIRRPKSPPLGIFPLTEEARLAGEAYDAAPYVLKKGRLVPKPQPGGGWGLRLPFLPNSPKQVLALADHLGIRLPDTNEKTLARFPHPTFQIILETRKLNDTLSNFLMQPVADGAVHPRFSYFPETWRKSCREPNLQSLPARHILANLIRAQLRARPGYVFVAADSSAIEAVLVGWLAHSQRYMRLAKAGVHGWLASAVMGHPIPLDATDLAVQCKAAKKQWPEFYDKCKRIVHGSNYGMTPNGIVLNYPGMFESLGDARKLQQFYLNSEPGRDVVSWQRQTMELAHRQGYLETPWGIRNYYTRALIYDSSVQTWKPGEQSKEAIAFMPQSIASSLQDRYILTLPAWLQDAVRLVRHDEILCEVPADRAHEGLEILEATMCQPIPELGGLTIGVEGKCGTDLNLGGLDD